MPYWLSLVLGVVGGVVLLWLLLIVALWLAKPDDARLKDAVRLLPDVIRLLKRLATDPATPKAVRIWLVLLFGYLALPIDVVPDFVPVLGFVDDAVIVALVLRYVTRTAGAEAIEKHWAGTPEGLAAVRKLCRITE
ncbi:YkvA family protein [Mycobacterium sp. SMC-4]|uniref:YkvA family protein n=1 Tax=Mycobacterium sp. SMC-4 TaxID=2857059 RepID=UPI0021B2ADC2|nr:DUF1232 domain-containing protein [Mycobacterium sp. SMC-4]UXA16744.1 DUF1232 domain-containing protein [Mycobacterium sp. SMC-4]